ncbi:MAG: hypothetical protein PW789_03100 [Edaphobacter sp.]|uniref:hypothetical protein n=1 Tax=Edaphobacter sp. TaxID=1934404 RepID=UPI0023971051|nr:hypothetical protein [Edaphobacter sp.]MDE1175572.1 hypothetical protein [Edaphobacter sp.]
MLFPFLLIAAAVVALTGAAIALDGSRDVFHPLVFIGPMLAFLYWWMPWKLYLAHGLDRFFDENQLLFVAALNLIGVTAFVVGCLSSGVRLSRKNFKPRLRLTTEQLNRLLVGGCISGGIGFACWSITIINVGGFVNAYSKSYTGGWDDSGYIRDGSLLLLVGLIMAVASLAKGGPRILSYLMLATFGLPWLLGALLMARRGPTFEMLIVLLMGWYINRRSRPAIAAVAMTGFCVGWLVLFLVTNRGSIYLGSDFDVKTDVSEIVETSDTGNEWIYGAGAVLSSQHRDHYFWMRRYLAQIIVRPIPSAVWPTKYEDFGVPELLHNAGTGEGFGDALGWKGADGSAPGIVADLWAEVWWFSPLIMALLGRVYGRVWRRAVTCGGAWASQYVVIAALSIYLVMQTMEAVIFRTLLLSIPCWLTWRYALAPSSHRSPIPSRHMAPQSRPQTLLPKEAMK